MPADTGAQRYAPDLAIPNVPILVLGELGDKSATRARDTGPRIAVAVP